MRKTLIPFLLNLLFSGFIGLLVGLAILLLPITHNGWALHHLLISSLIGAAIGTAARLSNIILYKYGFPGLAWGYIVTFLTTLAGCLVASYLSNAPAIVTMTIIAVAEPLALLTAYLNIKYASQLNEGLKRKQLSIKNTKRR